LISLIDFIRLIFSLKLKSLSY